MLGVVLLWKKENAMTRSPVRQTERQSCFQPTHTEAVASQPLPFIALGAAIGVLGAVMALI